MVDVGDAKEVARTEHAWRVARRFVDPDTFPNCGGGVGLSTGEKGGRNSLPLSRPDGTTHSRREYVSREIARAAAVSRLLGHSDEATTLRYYVHDAFSDDDNVWARMETQRGTGKPHSSPLREAF